MMNSPLPKHPSWQCSSADEDDNVEVRRWGSHEFDWAKSSRDLVATCILDWECGGNREPPFWQLSLPDVLITPLCWDEVKRLYVSHHAIWLTKWLAVCTGQYPKFKILWIGDTIMSHLTASALATTTVMELTGKGDLPIRISLLWSPSFLLSGFCCRYMWMIHLHQSQGWNGHHNEESTRIRKWCFFRKILQNSIVLCRCLLLGYIYFQDSMTAFGFMQNTTETRCSKKIPACRAHPRPDEVDSSKLLHLWMVLICSWAYSGCYSCETTKCDGSVTIPEALRPWWSWRQP